MRAKCLVVAIAVIACKRSTPEDSPVKRTLFRDLPDGAAIVFTGHEPKQPDGDLLGDCLAHSGPLHVAGAIAFDPPNVQARAVIEHAALADVASCVRSSQAVVVDPDHVHGRTVMKLGPAGESSIELVQLPDGNLYARADFLVDGPPYFRAITRADLDADVAAIAKRTVVDDAKVMTLLDHADASTSVTLAVDGSRTPIAAVLGDAWASIAIDAEGARIDMTLQIVDAAVADRMEQRCRAVAAKHELAMLEVSRAGDRFHIVARATYQQMANLPKIIN